MTEDERAIRDVMARWMEASRAGDTQAVLGLMTDDVVFQVPGHPPFGKAGFAAASAGMKDAQLDGSNEIVELRVLGDWAWMRAHIRMTMTVPGKPPMRRAGYTLTILQRDATGQWRVARDANLMTTEA